MFSFFNRKKSEQIAATAQKILRDIHESIDNQILCINFDLIDVLTVERIVTRDEISDGYLREMTYISYFPKGSPITDEPRETYIRCSKRTHDDLVRYVKSRYDVAKHETDILVEGNQINGTENV